MNSLLKIFAAAAALGLAPVAASGQAAAPAPAPAASQAAPAPGGATPTATPPGGAQPQDVSGPDAANGRPSDAQVAQSTAASQAAPEPGIGQPDGRMGLQDQFSPIGVEAAWFHNWILLPAITVISLFVLALLLFVIVRFRRSANPTPSRTTHNTLLEVVWTLVPVLILVVIAIPSIRLLANQYDPPRADLTIKAIGNQWYWEYEYPDHGVQLVSNILSDADAERRREPRLLAVDQRVVVPAGATVKVIVTSNDVVHSWGVPAFWAKIDAVPGRLNETWFRADRPGLYYGQCFELCGARHAYMPIAVEVVSREQFAAWVAAHGGHMPGAQPAAAAPAAARRPGITAGQADAATPAPAGVTPGTTTPPVTSQGAPNTRQGGSH
ncbi:MAG: cytochrome c oxidase subunit [Sphingomonadales bacterium]|jgi:cytochrome c oxidase subunit 2|nr:cytochrome c oxidase subunit [Sphingomonadales bacterium]